jgi:hypothetical protein
MQTMIPNEPWQMRLRDKGKERKQEWRQDQASLIRRAFHQQAQLYVQDLIEQFRGKIGLPSFWRVQPGICCPDEMPESEAVIQWDAAVWYAQMTIRCDASLDLLEWLVVHELKELMRWQTTELEGMMYDLVRKSREQPQSLRVYLAQQQRRARDQEIEEEIAALLGHARPMHLDQPSFERSPQLLYSTMPDQGRQTMRSLQMLLTMQEELQGLLHTDAIWYRGVEYVQDAKCAEHHLQTFLHLERDIYQQWENRQKALEEVPV